METVPYIGRLLNTIVVLVVMLSAFSLSYSVLRIRKTPEKIQYFGYFWLATAFLWLSSTLRNACASFDVLWLDQFFFFWTQIFLFLSGVFLAPYLIEKIFKNQPYSRATMYIYSVLAAVSIGVVLRFGVRLDHADSYSTEYALSPYAQNLFLLVIAPLLLLTLLDSFVHIAKYLRNKDPLYEIMAPLSILSYLLIGLFDEIGVIGGWGLIIFRIVFVGAFLMAYTAVLQETSAQEELKQKDEVFEI